MRKTFAVPLAIAALALSGCGREGVAAPAGPSTPATGATPATAPRSTASTTTIDVGPSTTQPPADPGTTATDPEQGVLAHWSLDPAFPVADTDSKVHVLVGPYECSDDTPRTPLRPGVRVVGGEIRITIDVSPLPAVSGRMCTDPTFPAVVELGTPINGRPLVDASCLLTGSRAGPTPAELCIQRP